MDAVTTTRTPLLDRDAVAIPEVERPQPVRQPIRLHSSSEVRSGLSLKLDASRLQALEHFFAAPGQQGVDLFHRLFAVACTCPADAPAPPDEGDGVPAALLDVESLSALGKLVHCNSQETITKYVSLFCACGFIKKLKIKHSRRVYLAFPTGSYSPPATLLADLDALLAKPAQRPKMKALARQVRGRYLASGSLSPSALSLSQEQPTLRHLLALLQDEQVDSSQRVRSAVNMVTTLLATALRSGEDTVGDAEASGEHRLLLRSTTQGDAGRPETRFFSFESPVQGDVRAKNDKKDCPTVLMSPYIVDASQESCALSRTAIKEAPKKGDAKTIQQMIEHLAATKSPSTGDAKRRTCASIPAESTNVGAESTRLGDSAPTLVDSAMPEHSRRGDVRPDVGDSEDVPNVNVSNYITQNINVNVSGVAQLLCHLLGESPSKRGIYKKLLTHEGCTDPEKITAALVYTLVHFHRDGTITNPASLFIARCRQFHHACETLPEQAADLVKRYGSLTHHQFLDEMRKPVSGHSSPGLQRITPQASSTSFPGPVVRANPRSSFALDPALKAQVEVERVVMTRKEAQEVMAAVAHDERTQQFRACQVLISATLDRYVVVVDTTAPDGPFHQTLVYSLQEWKQRLAQMKTWRDLFGLAPFSLKALIAQKQAQV